VEPGLERQLELVDDGQVTDAEHAQHQRAPQPSFERSTSKYVRLGEWIRDTGKRPSRTSTTSPPASGMPSCPSMVRSASCSRLAIAMRTTAFGRTTTGR